MPDDGKYIYTMCDTIELTTSEFKRFLAKISEQFSISKKELQQCWNDFCEDEESSKKVVDENKLETIPEEVEAVAETVPEKVIEETVPDYSGKSVKELQAIAKEKGIKGISKMKKNELIALLSSPIVCEEKQTVEADAPVAVVNVLAGLTVAKLRDLAKEKGIKGISKMKKEELIAAIEAPQAAIPEEKIVEIPENKKTTKTTKPKKETKEKEIVPEKEVQLDIDGNPIPDFSKMTIPAIHAYCKPFYMPHVLKMKVKEDIIKEIMEFHERDRIAAEKAVAYRLSQAGKLRVYHEIGLIWDQYGTRFIYSKKPDGRLVVIGRFIVRIEELTEDDIKVCIEKNLEYARVKLGEFAPEFPMQPGELHHYEHIQQRLRDMENERIREEEEAAAKVAKELKEQKKAEALLAAKIAEEAKAIPVVVEQVQEVIEEEIVVQHEVETVSEQVLIEEPVQHTVTEEEKKERKKAIKKALKNMQKDEETKKKEDDDAEMCRKLGIILVDEQGNESPIDPVVEKEDNEPVLSAVEPVQTSEDSKPKKQSVKNLAQNPRKFPKKRKETKNMDIIDVLAEITAEPALDC